MSASSLVWFGWLGMFVLLELPAVLHLVPWASLSEYVWGLENADGLLRWVVLFGLATLLTHLVARWP